MVFTPGAVHVTTTNNYFHLAGIRRRFQCRSFEEEEKEEEEEKKRRRIIIKN